jgi:hypothetical protein
VHLISYDARGETVGAFRKFSNTSRNFATTSPHVLAVERGNTACVHTALCGRWLASPPQRSEPGVPSFEGMSGAIPRRLDPNEQRSCHDYVDARIVESSLYIQLLRLPVGAALVLSPGFTAAADIGSSTAGRNGFAPSRAVSGFVQAGPGSDGRVPILQRLYVRVSVRTGSSRHCLRLGASPTERFLANSPAPRLA